MNHNILSPEGRIILAGGGGHALSLMEAIENPETIAGYTALSEAPAMPVDWLGDDSMAEKLSEEGFLFHMAFVYAGLPVMDKRRRLINKYMVAGAKFASIVAPSAIITRNSSIGEGCAILHRSFINRASLGNNVIVNSGAIVEHDCKIGDNTFIGPGAVIGGGVTIGEDCFIGLGSRIKNGVTIVPGVTVGMGMNIDRNLTEPGIYHGNPMRLHRLRK